MEINGTLFNCSLEEILIELQSQLAVNQIPLLQKTRDSGNNIMIQCPYHGNGQERRPSAGIRKDDGIFNCFACGETHSLPEVISHCFGYHNDLIGAFGWKWLNKNFLSVAVEERKDVKLDFSRTNNKSNSDIGTDRGSVLSGQQKITEEELDSYRYTHPYMYKRGLTDEVIERFDIGYDEGHRCITFPIRDISGKTLFIARRSVVTKFFNYPENVSKPLYGLYEIWNEVHKKSERIPDELNNYIYFPKEVIICESMLDALSFWTVNMFAVALNGLGNELQFKQLRELPCRKLILCTDSDKAGMQARKRIRKHVQNKLITEYILPEGRKDANECTKEELLNLQEVF